LGPTGPQGVPGGQGLTGGIGPVGPTGPSGTNGINGTNGTNGSVGPTGPAGPGANQALNTNSSVAFAGVLVNGSSVITSGNIGSQSVTTSKYVISDRGTPSNSLQYWEASGLGSTEAPNADWHNTIRLGHGSPLSYYSNTLAIRMTGSGVGDIYTQTIMNGSAQGWKKH
jgi:hypothetical protein